MGTLQPLTKPTPYPQQALAKKRGLAVPKTVPSTPQTRNTPQQKTPQNPSEPAKLNALPPFQWALGSGAVSGLLAGCVGAFFAGKRYEVQSHDGMTSSYNQRPFNKTCIEFNRKIAHPQQPNDPLTLLRSHTYTYRTLAGKTQVLTGLDVFGEDLKKEHRRLFVVDELRTEEEGYRLGRPKANQSRAEVDTTYPFAIYNEKGELQHFYYLDAQNTSPYFKVNWQGETFTGSIPINNNEGELSYLDALTGSINPKTGLLSAIPTVTLNTAEAEYPNETTITEYVQSAKEFLEGFHSEKIPLKLPVTAPPPLPAEAKLVKFPTHRLVAFSIGAIPTALVVTLIVGLVQWCLPPTKKQPSTGKPSSKKAVNGSMAANPNPKPQPAPWQPNRRVNLPPAQPIR